MGVRLPVDGKKVIEYRITLGTNERQIAEDISTSLRIKSLDPKAILEILDDPKKIITIAYSIATIAEILGIETGLPTAGDLPEVYEWFAKRGIKQDEARSEDNPSIFDLLKNLLSGEYGGYPGGY